MKELSIIIKDKKQDQRKRHQEENNERGNLILIKLSCLGPRNRGSTYHPSPLQEVLTGRLFLNPQMGGRDYTTGGMYITLMPSLGEQQWTLIQQQWTISLFEAQVFKYGIMGTLAMVGSHNWIQGGSVGAAPPLFYRWDYTTLLLMGLHHTLPDYTLSTSSDHWLLLDFEGNYQPASCDLSQSKLFATQANNLYWWIQ